MVQTSTNSHTPVQQTKLRSISTHCIRCGPGPESVIADRVIRTLPENLVFGGELKIVECRQCGLRYLNPMPDPRELSQIYNYDVYEDSTNNNPVLMEHFYDALLTYRPGLKDVLEIGCGTGDFLAWVQDHGLNVAGVEFADSAKRVKYNGPLYVGRMEDIDIPDGSYDAVLLLNVIEHLSDPMLVLKKIRKMLRPGGVLLLRHPNSALFFFLPYWLCVELPKYLVHTRLRRQGRKTGFTIVGFQNQHLFYFYKRTVVSMLQEAGFSVENFSTQDPYNRLRIQKSLKQRKFIEASIAGIRHMLGSVGLGPECLTVARASN